MTDLAARLRRHYEEAFRELAPKRPVPEIAVCFYPYVGINHTIRVRNSRVAVRIAEICRDMPDEAQRALAYILVSKLLRKKVLPEANEVYGRFIKTPEMRDRATADKRERGRKVITSSVGVAYDLDRIYDRLNEEHFGGRLPKPVLTWSAGRTYRILGHHDSTHETVVISRSLDSTDVPAYVVDYVVFHEMLHVKLPAEHRNGRRHHHTPAFRRDERRFPHFDEAERWIEKNVSKMKRNKRRR